MYENLVYDELKNLPEDKKAEAWGELHSSIPSNRELAQKLGISPIVVVNAVKKYVLGEPVGRANKRLKPESQLEGVKTRKSRKAQQKEDIQEVKPKRKYNRKAKAVSFEANEAGNLPVIETNAGSFLIDIKNAFSGEEARGILSGIGSALLKDRQYSLEIRISDK